MKSTQEQYYQIKSQFDALVNKVSVLNRKINNNHDVKQIKKNMVQIEKIIAGDDKANRPISR